MVSTQSIGPLGRQSTLLLCPMMPTAVPLEIKKIRHYFKKHVKKIVKLHIFIKIKKTIWKNAIIFSPTFGINMMRNVVRLWATKPKDTHASWCLPCNSCHHLRNYYLLLIKKLYFYTTPDKIATYLQHPPGNSPA